MPRTSELAPYVVGVDNVDYDQNPADSPYERIVTKIFDFVVDRLFEPSATRAARKERMQ